MAGRKSTSFRARVKVIEWQGDHAERVRIGNHIYSRDPEGFNTTIDFDDIEEEVRFYSMAAALLEAGAPERM